MSRGDEMKIIVCIDDRMGMMFNKRRISQDRIVREVIKNMNETIYMNEYSFQLYQDTLDNVIVDEEFIKHAQNHYCLIENTSIKDYQDDIDEIILFKWNRSYPADMYLDIDLSKYKLMSEEEFEGSSHHITKQIYRKDNL